MERADQLRGALEAMRGPEGPRIFVMSYDTVRDGAPHTHRLRECWHACGCRVSTLWDGRDPSCHDMQQAAKSASPRCTLVSGQVSQLERRRGELGVGLASDLKPQLVVLDECHACKNPKVCSLFLLL